MIKIKWFDASETSHPLQHLVKNINTSWVISKIGRIAPILQRQ